MNDERNDLFIIIGPWGCEAGTWVQLDVYGLIGPALVPGGSEFSAIRMLSLSNFSVR